MSRIRIISNCVAIDLKIMSLFIFRKVTLQHIQCISRDSYLLTYVLVKTDKVYTVTYAFIPIIKVEINAEPTSCPPKQTEK